MTPQLGVWSAVDTALLGSFQQGLQHTLNRFSAAGNRAGMKIRTKKTEVLLLSRNPRKCTLQVCGNTLQQVEKFKYVGVAFTSDGWRSEEIDTRIGKANAVLRELYRSVVTKRELSNNAKLSAFKSAFVPILTLGHESWVTIEKILFQVQATEMGFLRRVHGVTLRDKACSCEWNSQSPECRTTSLNRKIPAIRWFDHVSRTAPDRGSAGSVAY